MFFLQLGLRILTAACSLSVFSIVLSAQSALQRRDLPATAQAGGSRFSAQPCNPRTSNYIFVLRFPQAIPAFPSARMPQSVFLMLCRVRRVLGTRPVAETQQTRPAKLCKVHLASTVNPSLRRAPKSWRFSMATTPAPLGSESLNPTRRTRSARCLSQWTRKASTT